MKRLSIRQIGARNTLVIGVSAIALSVSQNAQAQTVCGDGSPGPVCAINNTTTSGPIAGTQGTATIVTNSGTITGNPSINQASAALLHVDNLAGGLIEGDVQGTPLLSFGVVNAGDIEGSVVLDDTAASYLFTGSTIYYIADGGEVAGNVVLGTNGFTSANFIQRGASDDVDGFISAGAGLDIYTKSYASTQSVAIGQYTLPTTFEIEGYEVRGAGTTLTLTGSGTSISLMGDGNVVNDATIGLVSTAGLYPMGVTVVPVAIGYYQTQQAVFRREQIPLGQPGSFYTMPFGSALTGFTNNGTVNGDIRLSTASFTNNGNINLASNGLGTVIRGAADKDFLFRNDGSIVMVDNGARQNSPEGEFEDGIQAAIRIATAIDSTQLKAVTVENGATGEISGGLSISGVATEFTFNNAGMISIGDNPFEIDRAVDIELGSFEIAQTAALREDAVSDSVTITNSGTLDGGIEAEVTTRTLSFTNSGHINADVNDDYAAAVNLSTDDWPDTPGGEDVNDAQSITFLNTSTGTIVGSVEMEANASLVTITNNGSITQALRGGHGPVVGAGSNSYPAEAIVVEQETALGAQLVFTNTGMISNADYAGGAVSINLEAGDISSGLPEAANANAAITVTNSGDIIASGGNYLTFSPALGLTSTQIGLDYSVALGAFADAEGTGSVSITNEAAGTINARGTAHMWTGSVQVVPDQQPNSGGIAIAAMADSVTIVNEGTILGGVGGSLTLPNGNTIVPINASDANFEGVWGGAIDTFGGSTDDITNSATGVIEGSVALRSGNDTFRNYGSFTGNLYLGAGDDNFVQGVNALFSGTADGGEGNDTFVLDLTGGGTANGSIYSQLINFEVLTTIGSGAVDIGGTEDDDDYNNTGTLDGDVALGGGDDSVTQSGTINGDVDLGEGNNSLNNTGTINGQVNLGTGDNQFTNAPNAAIVGDVQSGAGNDQFANQGTITGQVDLGDGNNQFTNTSNATITGNVQSGTGNDNLANQGTIDGDVYLDGGAPSQQQQTFALISPMAVVPTGGDDVMTNDKTVTGSVFAGAGNDRLTNTGAVGGDVDMGEGDDTLVLSGSWSIGGTATGGTGADTLNLTFAPSSSEGSPTTLDLGGFTSFEKLEIEGGVGKVEGEANFGAIDVNGGRLIGAADSTITADVHVGSGGTFGSAGKVVGDIAVASGGALSPGASPAVMTVVGDVSLASGSITTFEFVPAPGQSDQLLIDGNLTIAAGATLNMTGNRPLTPGVAYDMIVADKIDGTFTLGTWDHSAIQGFLRYVDGATADRLQLMGTFVAADDVTVPANLAIDYVNGLLISGQASSALLNAVPQLLDGDGYASTAAFALLSPEPYASATQIGVDHGLSLARTFRSGVAQGLTPEARPFTFASGFGNWRTLKADKGTGASRAKGDGYGILGGIGYGSESASVAAFVGYLDSDQKIAALGAKTKVDGMAAGVTGHIASGGFEFFALAAYDWGKADTKRLVPGNGMVSSDYRLRSFVLDAQAGYNFTLSDGWTLRPGIGLTHISTKRGAATESGSAAFALDVAGKRTNATFIDGGITLLGGKDEGATFQPWVQLGLRHQLSGDRPWASAGFVGNTAMFTVPGVDRKDTVITAGAGFSAAVSETVRLFASYQGEFGGGTGSQANLGFELAF